MLMFNEICLEESTDSPASEGGKDASQGVLSSTNQRAESLYLDE